MNKQRTWKRLRVMVTTATTTADTVAMATGMGVITTDITIMAMDMGMVMDMEDTIIMDTGTVTAMDTAMDMEDTMAKMAIIEMLRI